MKPLIVALVLIATPATAQEIISLIPLQFTIPKTVQLKSKGEVVGTITYSDRRFYLRDKNGAFIATIVVNSDGSKIAYDYDGKIINMPDVDVELDK